MENAIPFSSSEPSTQESEAQEAIRITVSKPISQGADGAGRNDGHGGPSILPESSHPRHTRDHQRGSYGAVVCRQYLRRIHTLRNEFGRIQTIRDAQKPRLSFTPERR